MTPYSKFCYYSHQPVTIQAVCIPFTQLKITPEEVGLNLVGSVNLINMSQKYVHFSWLGSGGLNKDKPISSYSDLQLSNSAYS